MKHRFAQSGAWAASARLSVPADGGCGRLRTIGPGPLWSGTSARRLVFGVALSGRARRQWATWGDPAPFRWLEWPPEETDDGPWLGIVIGLRLERVGLSASGRVVDTAFRRSGSAVS